jgi:AcrR family transcriptional regulator
MTAPTRREREKAETRQRILDAARELFATRGYDAVTMRSIAEKIEYTATALYFHFEDKEALLGALCTEDFLAFAKEFQASAGIADPVERIKSIGRAYIRFAVAHPNQYRFMFMTPLPPRHVDEGLLERGNPTQDAYAFLRNCVVDAIAAGRLRAEYADPDLAAQTLWAGVHGLVSLRIAKGCDPWFEWCDFERAAAAMLDAQIHGIFKPGKSGGSRRGRSRA